MIQVKTIEIKVYGRVQGVYFRQSAANFATSLRLAGYAQNLNDGGVEIIAQGKEESLEELLKWCQRGSLLANVEGMNYRWIDADKVYKNFEVKRSGSMIKDQVKSFFHLGKHISDKIINLNSDITVPQHVVIIPNGDRTWARERGLKPWEAYWYVQKNIDRLIDAANGLGIKHLTLWGFSTENWKRNPEEVKQLMKVFNTTIDMFKTKLVEQKVGFRHLGRKDRLPEKLRNKIVDLENLTKDFTDKTLNAAIDYGGRDEILRAIDSALKLGKDSINEQEFSSLLDTNGLPDPDLIIRTAGEKRLSGMMPWQSVYAEFYSTNVYFPDFSAEHLKQAIVDYSSRKRTFGGDKNLLKHKSNTMISSK